MPAEVKPTSAEARGRAAEDDLFITSLLSRKLAEAESTYHSSAEAETVVAEAARKTARKTGRIRKELLYMVFWHRSCCIL